ncbi:hypothetical protein CRG98_040689 [Punica granatum]|uniref:Phytocyanin domain-containing protein n=1 Tax=Punica granatum TaxID=22663 RepID=A0A2I0I4P2_PUNGR|nr:hypothetical protein CRG98_040689 [Punica granatum]
MSTLWSRGPEGGRNGAPPFQIYGGSQGWTVGANYAAWAAGQTFTVGDTLGSVDMFNATCVGGFEQLKFFSYYLSSNTFRYTPEEVSKADYDNCNTASPIKTYNSGDDRVVLSSTGPILSDGSTPPSTSSPTSPSGITGTSPTAPPPPLAAGRNGASGVFCTIINIILGVPLVLATVGASMF